MKEGMGMSNTENVESIDYSAIFVPDKKVYVIKKDGSKEAFNVLQR